MQSSCGHASTASWPQITSSDVELTKAAQMFHALRDPARLRLLLRLSQGELCVAALADAEQAQDEQCFSTPQGVARSTFGDTAARSHAHLLTPLPTTTFRAFSKAFWRTLASEIGLFSSSATAALS